MTAFSDPDAAIAQVELDIRQAQERAARASEVRAAIDRIRGTAKSPRGEVTATADVSGRLTDLVLADDATDLRPADLARLIRETVAAAQQHAGAQAVAVADEEYGEGSAVSVHLREEIRARVQA